MGGTLTRYFHCFINIYLKNVKILVGQDGCREALSPTETDNRGEDAFPQPVVKQDASP